MLNNPAVVNSLAKLRKNRNKENPLSGSSDHLSSLISDTSYAYSQLYGESSTSQVLSNTDTNGKSRRMANSGFEYGDRKASKDADKSEIQKKRKYEEDSHDDSKKQKVSPSVSVRGITAKRIVDKYPGSSGPANIQREKHHTRNGDPRDKTLDICFRGDKHSLNNGTKEDKKAYENDKRRKGEKETSVKKDEKEKSVRKGEKSVRKDHIYERDKKTISTSKTDHSTIGATEKYDQRERNDKRRKGEKEKTVRKDHIYESDKKTISTFKTGHSTIGATEKYDQKERNDKRRKGEQENSVTKDHIYERDKNTRDTSKSDHIAIGATEKYDQRERNSLSDKTRHKRLDPRSHESSPSSKGVCTENTDLGNGASHLTPISEKGTILEDDVEHKDSISPSDKKRYTEPGQHGIKTRDSPIHLTQGLPNLVSMECIDHNIIPVSSPVLQQVVDMESGVANVEQNNCPYSSQVSPKTISKEADDLGSTSHAPLISQKTVILGHNPSPNNICSDGDNKSNSAWVLAKSIGLEHVQHVKQVDDVHHRSIILEKTLNVKGDVKAVKQRNRTSNIPLASLKRKWVPDGDTTTKQSDRAVHLAIEVILEGGDHIDDEVNHLLPSPKTIRTQYTTVYSPSSNSENKALKGLSSAAETDETNDHGKGAKSLETGEINDHGKGARCLETDETNDHGNGAKFLETDETNDQGKGARCIETDETNDHGKGAKCLKTDEINNHGNGAKCLDIGNPDSNKNESAVANMESNILKLDLENIKQTHTVPSAVLSSGNDAESQGDAESEGGNALDKEQPYILRIENIPQEIKSWKTRLEKFKKSNYSLCETWEYPFFSNVLAHKSVNTSTPQSKPHALGVNEKLLESNNLTFNESAILSQRFCTEYDMGSEASGLAVPVDDAAAEFFKGSEAADLAVTVDDAESQGDALDEESSDDSDSSDSSDEESSSSVEKSSSSSSDEQSLSSDDTSSHSDSDVDERNSVYPASSGIHNNSQQTVNGSDNPHVFKLFDRLKPLNELFSSMLSSQNRRTDASKTDVSKVSKTSVSSKQTGKGKDSKANDASAKIVSDKRHTISDKDKPVFKVSKTSASHTQTGKAKDSKAKDTTAKIVSDKSDTISDKDKPGSKVSKTSASHTQRGKAIYSKAKDTTAKIVSDKSDTISDKYNPVYNEKSFGYPCISLDDDNCSLQLHVISDEEISDASSLEDGELRSESPDDYIVSKRLTERKPNFEPLIKLKTPNISASTSGQQRGQRKGTQLSMDLYRPITGESHSSNQATKAFSTLKGYKIPRKSSLGSQKRPFSDVGSIDRTPKIKRLEKSPSQSVGW